jgi:TonB family protein
MVAEDWTREWERRIVNGVYPLRRFLGRSNHSVVFLTECPAQDVAQAAIKILPAIPALADAQLAQWRTVAALSHPHLVRLIDAGRCQLGGHNFLFVVMEHAEQNLAQILRGRPLTPEEVRDLLPATLDALAYLHSQNLVHGGLKPPNFLAVDDQLKLASDTIRPAGERGASIAKPSLYDPPEAKKGRMPTAGDAWGLGITIVEALTQTPPAWSRERSDEVSLPAEMAPEFVDTVRRCLNRDPGQRPAIAELMAQFNLAPAATAPSVVAPPSLAIPPSETMPPSSVTPLSEMVPSSATMPPSEPTPPPAVTPPSAAPPTSNEPSPVIGGLSAKNSPPKRPVVIAIIVVVVALCAVWAAMPLFRRLPTIPQTDSMPPPAPPAVAPEAAVENPSASIGASLPTVLHQEIPDVSPHARESIRGGVINITVRVSVDRSGDVVTAALVDRASSKYFKRAALDAARKWKFAKAADQASRVWLLHFEFTRADTTAQATALQGEK